MLLRNFNSIIRNMYFSHQLHDYQISLGINERLVQNNERKKQRFAPVREFSANSAINWNKSIPEIDQQLYKKSNLNAEEIVFVESMIKPMN
ncbi:MAG: hypothetical protein JJU02_16970 [Cryomorphaceae bacterium]|nr:hypothetical protein [Cryomorphaceae bacterium]